MQSLKRKGFSCCFSSLSHDYSFVHLSLLFFSRHSDSLPEAQASFGVVRFIGFSFVAARLPLGIDRFYCSEEESFLSQASCPFVWKRRPVTSDLKVILCFIQRLDVVVGTTAWSHGPKTGSPYLGFVHIS
jgi:hypothetical protein